MLVFRRCHGVLLRTLRFLQTPPFGRLAIRFGLLVAGLVGLHLAALIAEHVFAVTAIWPSLDVWKITTDRGLGELCETAMLVVTVVSLWQVAKAQGDRTIASFAVLFAWIAADNILSLHEQVGDQLASLLSIDSRVGEVVGFLPFLALFLVVISRMTAADQRKGANLFFVAAIAAVGGFAVVIDFLHGAVIGPASSLAFKGIVSLVEDGGELLSIAAICCGALSLRHAVVTQGAFAGEAMPAAAAAGEVFARSSANG